MVGELNTYSEVTPVLTDRIIGVDDPSGTWSVKAFTFAAARTLLQANFTNLTVTNATANTASISSTGYSLTGTDATNMVDLAGTWNTTGAPTAFKVNITNTASGSASKIFDFQIGGTPVFAYDKAGVLTLANPVTTSLDAGIHMTIDNFVGFGTPANVRAIIGGTNAAPGIKMAGTAYVGWDDGGANTVPDNNTPDLALYRDAAAMLALRNGTTAAQQFLVYANYGSATDYHRMGIRTAKTTLSGVSGATVTATNLIPDGAVLVGVTTKVTTGLGTGNGTTGYNVGDGTDADRFGAITGTASGTSSDNRDWTAGTVECFLAATSVVLTAVGGNFDGTGVIDVCVMYLTGASD